MPEPFEFDVFLSHANAYKPAVRDLAERLKGDGLRVWLDELSVPARKWARVPEPYDPAWNLVIPVWLASLPVEYLAQSSAQ